MVLVAVDEGLVNGGAVAADAANCDGSTCAADVRVVVEAVVLRRSRGRGRRPLRCCRRRLRSADGLSGYNANGGDRTRNGSLNKFLLFHINDEYLQDSLALHQHELW